MPSSAQRCSGESQLLESLQRTGTGAVGFARRQGAPWWLSHHAPDYCAGNTEDAPSCCGCISKPGLVQPCSKGPGVNI